MPLWRFWFPLQQTCFWCSEWGLISPRNAKILGWPNSQLHRKERHSLQSRAHAMCGTKSFLLALNVRLACGSHKSLVNTPCGRNCTGTKNAMWFSRTEIWHTTRFTHRCDWFPKNGLIQRHISAINRFARHKKKVQMGSRGTLNCYEEH